MQHDFRNKACFIICYCEGDDGYNQNPQGHHSQTNNRRDEQQNAALPTMGHFMSQEHVRVFENTSIMNPILMPLAPAIRPLQQPPHQVSENNPRHQMMRGPFYFRPGLPSVYMTPSDVDRQRERGREMELERERHRERERQRFSQNPIFYPFLPPAPLHPATCEYHSGLVSFYPSYRPNFPCTCPNYMDFDDEVEGAVSRFHDHKSDGSNS